MERSGQPSFQELRESLMNLPAIGHPSYQIPFFPFVYEKEGNALEVLTPNHWDQNQPIGYYNQQLGQGLRAIMATALLVKTTEKIV